MKKLIFGLLLGVVGFVVSGCGAPLKTIQITDLREELKTVEPMAIHFVDTPAEQFATDMDRTTWHKMVWPNMTLKISRNCTNFSYNPTKPILSVLVGFPVDMMLAAAAPGSGIPAHGILTGDTICQKDSPILTTISITTHKASGAYPDKRIEVKCVSPQNQLLTTQECIAVTEAALIQWNPKAHRIQLFKESKILQPYKIITNLDGSQKLVPNTPPTK